MPEDPPNTTKLRLECQKLEAEIRELEKPTFRKPPILISFGGLVIALLVALGQCQSFSIKAERAQLEAEKAQKVRDEMKQEADSWREAAVTFEDLIRDSLAASPDRAQDKIEDLREVDPKLVEALIQDLQRDPPVYSTCSVECPGDRFACCKIDPSRFAICFCVNRGQPVECLSGGPSSHECSLTGPKQPPADA